MRSVRQHEPGGELFVESLPVPEPGPGEVLVKMAAAPINPSDLAILAGRTRVHSWPFTPGMEGSGTIVKPGRGLLPLLRLGKRVACSPGPGGEGTWAEYMLTSATRTVPLPGKVGMQQGSMMLVNPMTAMAFIHMARRGRHSAMVNNAASSALGKMLIRLADRHSIPLVSIVRTEERAAELKKTGAAHVLSSSNPSFGEELMELANQLGATLILDAIGGKETGRLLKAAPAGSTLVAYARLSGDQILADPADLISMGKKITGFQLGNWLENKDMLFKLRLARRVGKLLSGPLSTRVHATFPLEQVGQAIESYREHMSRGKILLVCD